MLGKSNDVNDAQTSGVLIQYLREISAYLREMNISRKTTTLAAAVLVLAGLLGIRYREEGTLATHQLKRSGQRTADILRADRGTEDSIDV